ncbi:MAG TPA: hypothetical protein VEU08_14635 [Vicinamibacterales bacterium]|nr:hypothetical protein [Vicinamibacterales bacterium]
MDETRIPTLFRRHNDGTVTDIFEDECVWVRDDEAGTVQIRDLRDPEMFVNAPNTFEGLREYFQENLEEGVMFVHADGRMAQIRRRDFGL